MALTDQLLTNFREKFGIVTVVNATFYEVDGKKPLISFDTLKMSNITLHQKVSKKKSAVDKVQNSYYNTTLVVPQMSKLQTH